MIIALAGRRIDRDDAQHPRFPLKNREWVRERLAALFKEKGASTLVGSGACGADLLAMDVAGGLGLRRCMVLPFGPNRFREASVTDRPGDWGPLFDRIVGELQAEVNLVVLDFPGKEDEAYAEVNRKILDEARRLAQTADGSLKPVLAVLVWDGETRGPGDISLAFAEEARARGMPVAEVLTIL